MNFLHNLKNKFLTQSPTEDFEETGPEVMDCTPEELGEPIEVCDDFDEEIDEEEELRKVEELAARGEA